MKKKRAHIYISPDQSGLKPRVSMGGMERCREGRWETVFTIMLIMHVHMPTAKQDDHPGPVGGTEDYLASLEQELLSIPLSKLTQFEKIGEGMCLIFSHP